MALEARIELAWLHAAPWPPHHGALLLRLLAELRGAHTLREAARRTGLSYRFAWGLLVGAARACGAPLVTLQPGRGAALTPLGERLLEIDRALAERLAPHLESARREAQAALEATGSGAEPTLVVHASHDLALAELRAVAAGRVKLELSFHGSEECLQALARRRCDVAGFHASEDEPPAPRGRSQRVIHFAIREQGLMTRRGARVRCVRDLLRPGVRMINRQPGSGTRRLVDRMLAAEGIEMRRVQGYGDEELTHLAVAATVAAGRADAGFGIRAAAVQYGLTFVPLVREHYYLACQRRTFESVAFGTLRELMHGRRFRSRVARLPGYDVSKAGEPVINSP